MDKKKNNVFLKLLIIIFIIYLGLFIASQSGYYEKNLNKEVVFTSKAIKQFEKDVEDGKNIDLNSYIKKDNRDYSNSLTKAGDVVSDATVKFFTQGISNIVDVFKTLFM